MKIRLILILMMYPSKVKHRKKISRVMWNFYLRCLKNKELQIQVQLSRSHQFNHKVQDKTHNQLRLLLIIKKL